MELIPFGYLQLDFISKALRATSRQPAIDGICLMVSAFYIVINTYVLFF